MNSMITNDGFVCSSYYVAGKPWARRLDFVYMSFYRHSQLTHHSAQSVQKEKQSRIQLEPSIARLLL